MHAIDIEFDQRSRKFNKEKRCSSNSHCLGDFFLNNIFKMGLPKTVLNVLNQSKKLQLTLGGSPEIKMHVQCIIVAVFLPLPKKQ